MKKILILLLALLLLLCVACNKDKNQDKDVETSNYQVTSSEVSNDTASKVVSSEETISTTNSQTSSTYESSSDNSSRVDSSYNDTSSEIKQETTSSNTDVNPFFPPVSSDTSSNQSTSSEELLPEPLPWEIEGAKQPSEYTWEEFEALGNSEQEAFFEWFDNSDDFEAWMENAQNPQPETNYPWENGGKLPSEYTWAEFEALSDAETEGFFEWFATTEDFEAWMENAQNPQPETNYPWENGGKLPSEYTWAEFEALSDVEQEGFFEWFATAEDFETWMETAQNPQPETNYPWENGGKLPSEYTWAEFEALSDAETEAFFEWFATVEDFEAWMENAQLQQ